jgi:hemolysin III
MLIGMDRITLGKMQNPVRGFVHGTAAIAALVGLIVLLALNPGGLGLTLSLAVYAGSLVAMFTISTLYHTIPWTDTWKRRMQRLDHSAIFLVVAGTFTPFAQVALEGAWKVAMLTAVWAAAGVGIVMKLVEKHVRLSISVTIQSAMGWATVISMWQIASRLGVDTVVLIGVGGVIYTAGMIMFLTKRPRLAPHIFSSHELFHVMVVAASSVHFYAVVTQVLPAAA